MKSLVDFINEGFIPTKYNDFFYITSGYKIHTVKDLVKEYSSHKPQFQPTGDVLIGERGPCEEKVFIVPDGKKKIIDAILDLNEKYADYEVYAEVEGSYDYMGYPEVKEGDYCAVVDDLPPFNTNDYSFGLSEKKTNRITKEEGDQYLS